MAEPSYQRAESRPHPRHASLVRRSLEQQTAFRTLSVILPLVNLPLFSSFSLCYPRGQQAGGSAGGSAAGGGRRTMAGRRNKGQHDTCNGRRRWKEGGRMQRKMPGRGHVPKNPARTTLELFGRYQDGGIQQSFLQSARRMRARSTGITSSLWPCSATGSLDTSSTNSCIHIDNSNADTYR